VSTFISSPKKGDVTNCTNNCTIALFPHANKILLRIIQKQLELYVGNELPMEQAGLRKWHGARDQITNVLIMDRAREHHKNVKLFYRLHKGF